MNTENLKLKIRNNISTLIWLDADNPLHLPHINLISKETYSLFDIVEENHLREIPRYGFALGDLYRHFKNTLDSTPPIKI